MILGYPHFRKPPFDHPLVSTYFGCGILLQAPPAQLRAQSHQATFASQHWSTFATANASVSRPLPGSAKGEAFASATTYENGGGGGGPGSISRMYIYI